MFKTDIKKEFVLLVVCIVLLISVNYSFLDSKLESFLVYSETKPVEIQRVIDGDTVIYNENGTEISVRLLGINTPEKGERFYSDAKRFLEKQILNKSINLVYGEERKGKYGRELAYIFYGGKNVNLELVRKGYGNYYFPSGRNRYYGDFVEAWEGCLDRNQRLCEFSKTKCSDCIQLERIDKFEQETVFYNSCDFVCNLTDWSVKDEGRKKFIFPEFALKPQSKVVVKVGNKTNTEDILYWEGENYVWTSTGDSLFLRDREGKLVLWKIVS